MSTLKHGTTTNVRVTKGDEVIFSGRCDVAHGEDGTWSLTPVPLPEEPPLCAVVHVPSLNQWQRWTRLNQPTGRNWVDNRAEWSSWEQVCALGTPEVLEPDSVKALRAELSDARERAGRYAADANLAESKVEQAETERNAALSILASVEDQANEWATADYEPANDASAATLNATNRHGREILHLLAATEDEPAEPAEPAPVEVTDPYVVGEKWRDRLGHVWRLAEDGWHMFEFSDGDLAFMEGPYTTDFLVSRNGPLALVETGGQS